MERAINVVSSPPKDTLSRGRFLGLSVAAFLAPFINPESVLAQDPPLSIQIKINYLKFLARKSFGIDLE